MDGSPGRSPRERLLVDCRVAHASPRSSGIGNRMASCAKARLRGRLSGRVQTVNLADFERGGALRWWQDCRILSGSSLPVWACRRRMATVWRNFAKASWRAVAASANIRPDTSEKRWPESAISTSCAISGERRSVAVRGPAASGSFAPTKRLPIAGWIGPTSTRRGWGSTWA